MSYVNYSTLDDPDWTPLLYSYHILSVVNIIVQSFYMFIVTTNPDKREGKLYRHMVICSQIALTVLSLYWSMFMAPVFLFPFPGGYSMGIMWTTFGIKSHSQYTIACFLFGTYFLFLLSLVLARLKIIVRKESIFFFEDKYYVGLALTGFCVQAIYPAIMFHLSQTSLIDQKEYVREKNPNLMYLFDIENITIYNSNPYFVIYCIGLVIGIPAAGVTYAVVSFLVIYEIRMQQIRMSKASRNFHIRCLKNLLLHHTATLIFCAVAPTIMASCLFVPPDYNTHGVLTVCHAAFSTSAIASALVMFLLNSNYRNYIIFRLFAKHITPTRTKVTIVSFKSKMPVNK